MMESTHLLYYALAILAMISFLITVSNSGYLNLLNNSNTSQDPDFPWPLVSVLLPARNEEDRIGQCLKALDAQNYTNLEIIVLDDRSNDETVKVVKSFVQGNSGIKLIHGTEPPHGWIGKLWACHQLSLKATGDFLLFMDSDTILSPDTISAAVRNSIKADADLFTTIPQRMAKNLSERLMYPFIDWSLFCWIPLKLAQRTQSSLLSAGFGQFMLFKTSAYRLIGGHEIINDDPLDDFNLARLARKKKLKVELCQGTHCVKVLPYRSNVEAVNSISRSVFPALNYSISVFSIFSMVIIGLGFIPITTVLFTVLFHTGFGDIFFLSLFTLCIVTASWFITCKNFGHSMAVVACYPISMAMMILVGSHSVLTYILGVANWKSRKISIRKIRF